MNRKFSYGGETVHGRPCYKVHTFNLSFEYNLNLVESDIVHLILPEGFFCYI